MSNTRIYLNGKRKSHVHRLTHRHEGFPDVHFAWCGIADYMAGLEPGTVPTRPMCKSCMAILEAIRIQERIEATGDETVELPLFNIGIDEDWLRDELEGIAIHE